jgi:hypothetical protein
LSPDERVIGPETEFIGDDVSMESVELMRRLMRLAYGPERFVFRNLRVENTLPLDSEWCTVSLTVTYRRLRWKECVSRMTNCPDCGESRVCPKCSQPATVERVDMFHVWRCSCGWVGDDPCPSRLETPEPIRSE